MLRTYAAIFEDDSEKQRCSIKIPNLEYESEIDYTTNEELLKRAEDELSFALWLYEEREGKLPKANTISDKELPAGGVLRFLSSDYDKYKQSLSVKEIEIS